MITDEQPTDDQQQPPQEPVMTVKISEDNAPIVPVVEETPVVTDTPPVETPPTEEPPKEVVPTVEEPKPIEEAPTLEISDEAALAYLKEKHGIEVTSVDDLKPKELKKYHALVEKAQEFIDKTGNANLGDFLETQKDWKAEAENNPEKVIKKYLKEENPNLSKEDIDFLYSDEYEFDKDSLEDDSERRRKIKSANKLNEAVKFYENRKSEYEIPKGSLEDSIPTEYKEAYNFIKNLQQEQKAQEERGRAAADFFNQETEKVFGQSFEGFKFKIGDDEVTIKPENVEETKKHQSDFNNFYKKHVDKTTGKIKDAGNYHLAMYAANDPVKFAEHFYKLGQANFAAAEAKESKNITMDQPRQVSPQGQNKITVKVAGDS